MNGETETFEISGADKRIRWLGIAILILVSAGVFAVFSRIAMLMWRYESNSATVVALQLVVAGGFFLLAASPLLYAVHLAVGLRSIALGPDSLTAKTPFTTNVIRYADINPVASIRATLDRPVPRSSLVLADQGGRKLLAVPRGFASFASLGEKVFALAGEQAVVVENVLAAPENAEGRSSRRNVSLWLGLAALLFLTAAAVLGLEERGARMLETQGRVAQGVVVKHYVDKDQYHRITYSFRTLEGDEIIRDASLPEAQWAPLTKGTHVSVKYMRTYPEYNRIQGERDIAMIWLIVVALCITAVCILSLLCVLSGWRVHVANGRLRLARLHSAG